MQFNEFQPMRKLARENLKSGWLTGTLVFGIINIIPLLFIYVGFVMISFALYFLSTTSLFSNAITTYIMLGVCLLVMAYIFISLNSALMSTLIIDVERYRGNGYSLLSRFERFIRSGTWLFLFKVQLLVNLKVILYSLLLIVPGIIKALQYSQAAHIAAESITYKRPMSVSSCLNESSKMMNEQKMNLIKLYLSFVGWFIALLVLSSFISQFAFALVATNKYSVVFALIYISIHVFIFGALACYVKMTLYLFYQDLVLNNKTNTIQESTLT